MSKRKNKIDVEYSLCLLTDAGLEPQKFNEYQIRIFSKNENSMYDWYHTTGSLVLTKNGKPRSVGIVPTVERIINVINAHDTPIR